MNNADKKVVVITGAAKGLGKELALAFARADCEIVGLYRSDDAAAQAVESEFKASGYRGTFIKQDITEDGDTWLEFDKALKLIGGGAHFTLIANASPPFVPKPFHLIDWLEISGQIETNVKGTFLVFKKLLPFMVKARAGTMISVLTAALHPPPKGFAAYVTAKSALHGLTRAIAAEYVSKNLRVFSVSPGFMDTALTGGWSEHLKALIYSTAGGGARQPSDAARAIFDLTENQAVAGAGEDYPIG